MKRLISALSAFYAVLFHNYFLVIQDRNDDCYYWAKGLKVKTGKKIIDFLKDEIDEAISEHNIEQDIKSLLSNHE